MQLLHDFKERKGYWELKEESLDRIVWGTRFERGYGLQDEYVYRHVSQRVVVPLRQHKGEQDIDNWPA
jgi:hypothetical protein